MIGRVRESRNPKKVIRVTLMESYGEIGREPVNLYKTRMFYIRKKLYKTRKRKKVKKILGNAIYLYLISKI